MKPSKKTTARSLAMSSLLALERDGRYANLEIDARLKEASLDPADRARYTRLVYGVTERRITLDWIIGRYSPRGADPLDADVRCALRLGLYQLLYMDRIPEHAAVGESVDLVPHAKAGYVNAVLRAFLRAGKRIDWPDEADGLTYFSVKYSVPEPLCAIYRDALGDPGELGDLLEALKREPPVGLRVNTLRLTPEEAAARTGGQVSKSAPDLVLLDSLTSDARAGIAEGLWFVQDEASRIVSAAVGAKPGERVIDTCACPGGKRRGSSRILPTRWAM
jgi:16S rRNA (cytosine967-C5)-methyltransferase